MKNYKKEYNDLVSKINVIHAANKETIKLLESGKMTDKTALEAYKDMNFAFVYSFDDVLKEG